MRVFNFKYSVSPEPLSTLQPQDRVTILAACRPDKPNCIGYELVLDATKAFVETAGPNLPAQLLAHFQAEGETSAGRIF